MKRSYTILTFYEVDITMTGEEKVAAILLSLKPEVAAEVMKNFSQVDVMRVGQTIARMEKISQTDLREAAKDLCKIAEEGGGFISVNKETMKKLFMKVMDEKTASRLVEGITSGIGDDNPIRDKLKFLDANTIINFTRQEHPQTTALILAHLLTDQAAEVLEGLPPATQIDITRRMASLSTVPPDIVAEMASTLEKDVFSVSSGGLELGGVKVVADILNNINRTTQQTILTNLEEKEPILSAEIRDLMFNFDDVLNLPDKAIQEVIKETAQADLAKALKIVDEVMKERIYRNMSRRAAEILKEEIQILPPTRLADIDKAQKTITETARRLEAAGTIIIQRKGDVKDAFV